MKIETKFNVGDKVLHNGKVKTVTCIEFNTNSDQPFYQLETEEYFCRAKESSLSPANRYNVGDLVWCILSNASYQGKVTGVFRTGRYLVESHRLRTHINEENLYPTKESLIAALPCHEYQV